MSQENVDKVEKKAEDAAVTEIEGVAAESRDAIESSETDSVQTVKKRKKREKKGFSYYFKGGLIACLIGMLVDAIYNALSEGLFGRIFKAYTKEQTVLEGGYISSLFCNAKLKGRARRARGVFAEGFESSLFLGFFERIKQVILESSLKNFGNYTLTFGLYTVFVYFARQFVPAFDAPSIDDFLAGSVMILASIPMLMSKKSLAEALGSSIGALSLLCEGFGFREESFEVPPKQTRFKANAAIILGMLSGISTFIIPPAYIPIAIIGSALVALIFSSPEVGVIVSFFLLPFFSLFPNPSFSVATLIGVSSLGYAVKLIRGKRILKFEILDTVVLLFSVMIFASGAVTVGGIDSFKEAVLACALLLVYFLTVNMMRTEKWIRRCVMALVSSATVVALIGVLEYFFADLSPRWLDTEYFSDIRGRVVSLFDNSNVLAFYLVMIFPLALDLLSRCKLGRERFLAFFSCTAITLCIVFTWSRGAWLGLIAATLVYLLIRSRKTLKAIFAFCLTIPILPFVIPSNVVNRFMSIGDLADSSTYYRVHVWKGSLAALADNLFGGVGYGNSAFERAYIEYAYAGIEAAEHSHNLFLQIAIQMGIVGLLIFVIAMLLFAQKNFEFFSKHADKKQVGIAAAAFSAVVAALVMGMFDYIWYNNRLFLLFWALVGISCASVRVRDADDERRRVETVCDKTSAYIDLEM